MKVVFATRNPKLFFNVRSIAAALLRRGHDLEIVFDERLARGDSRAPFEEFAKEFPQARVTFLRNRRGLAASFLFSVRELRSFRRYLLDRRQSRFYLKRWLGNVPLLPRLLISLFPFLCRPLRSVRAGTILARIEELFPPDRNIFSRLSREKPDVVVASPTTMHPQSVELEVLKAARALSIPTVLPVFSWDNLTTKGLIHVIPDLLLAWNDMQKSEAIRLHGVPAERIRVIGAPTFDHWFGIKGPSADRAAFADRFKLSPRDPILLYLGSSQRTAPDETWLVKRLRVVLDRSPDPKLRATQILLRPHPMNLEICEGWSHPRVAFVGRESKMPGTRSVIQDFFDMLFHAAAATGVSTSSMIDAILLGKPVISLVTKTYTRTQSEALHFRELAAGGAISLAPSPDSFASVFSAILAGEDALRTKREEFVGRYLYPKGRDRSAGERAADEIEARAARPASGFTRARH